MSLLEIQKKILLAMEVLFFPVLFHLMVVNFHLLLLTKLQRLVTFCTKTKMMLYLS